MKNFITLIKKISVAVIYILIWQLVSATVGNKILMAGPTETLKAIIRIVQAEDFLLIITNSLFNILTGFIPALLISVIIAFMAFKTEYVKMLLGPVIHIFKSVPVASFIILILIWMGSDGIARVVAFIISVPVIYSGTLHSLISTDKKLLEMTYVFRMNTINKYRYIYMPQIKQRLKSDAALGLGMCFKAGVAAEVIGVAKNTLGEQIYLSKIYLSTDELFGWTIIIMILAYVMEMAVRLFFGGMETIHGKR